MAILNADAQLKQCQAWQDYLQALSAYQYKHSFDDNYDPEKVSGYISGAVAAAALYFAKRMHADFKDAEHALESLQDATKKAKAYVDTLTAQVESWNRFADIASAMAGFASAILSCKPGDILSAADDVRTCIGPKKGTLQKRSITRSAALTSRRDIVSTGFTGAAAVNFDNLNSSVLGAAASARETTMVIGEPVQVPYTIQRVFFGTDRKRLPDGSFSGFREFEPPYVTQGCCDVSIPATHVIGVLEEPKKFLGLIQLKADPKKHIVVLKSEVLGKVEFASSIKAAMQGRDENSALLFVHGYNVTFETAVRRAAQIAFDLQYPGLAFTYSWASNGDILDYSSDETNIEWTYEHLQGFLNYLSSECGVRSIDVIAHSMGNRAVTEVVDRINRENSKLRMRTIILAAPDIDRAHFLQIAAALPRHADSVTLYSSKHDAALNLSMQLHHYPRAGDGNTLVVCDGISTIDASSVPTDFLGHGYYCDTRTVVEDIYYVLRGRKPPRAGLRREESNSGPYWVIAP